MTPDVVELTRGLSEAQGVEETIAYYALDAVYDLSRLGMGVFEGREAIRAFLDDWHRSYDDYEDDLQEIVDLGHGVVFAAAGMSARPLGSPGHARVRTLYGYIFVWADGKLVRTTPYPDVEEARTAAERLAKERDR